MNAPERPHRRSRPIHNRLTVLRAERALSRQDLARALGVNYQTIGFLERGHYNPSLELAFRIGEYFGLPSRPFSPARRPPAEGSALSRGPVAWRAVMKQLGRVVVVATVAAAVSGCVPRGAATPAPAGTPIDRELAVATFDSAWNRIHHTYYDPDFRGVDWRGVRSELRPRAEAVATVDELRLVLNDMLGRLGESHFAIIPRESADALDPEELRSGAAPMPADAGLELRWIGDEVVVTRVADGGAAAGAGVRAGWVLEAIGERAVAGWVAALAELDEAARPLARLGVLTRALQLLQGTEGDRRALRFRDGSDARAELELTLRPMAGEAVRFGNLPTLFAWLEHARLPAGDACVGLIRFNVWMTPLSPRFSRALDGVSDCAGIVVDLRGNFGGVGAMAMGTAGAFLDRQAVLGVMRSRQGELRFVSIPRRVDAAGRPTTPFAGPVAILVDDMSMSTSEIFAAGLQAIGRARVFGTRTPGMALPAGMVRLPNQDVLYHAFAEFVDPDGRRIEGEGVRPDEEVPLTRADLLAGRDAALERALGWIRAQASATSDGH
jgi:carboxyl-terminal processing protease